MIWTICDRCGALVPDEHAQKHTDWHLALEGPVTEEGTG